jgi:hypothetical protein
LSDWTRQSDVLLSNTPATTCDDEREGGGKVQDEINRKEGLMLCVGLRQNVVRVNVVQWVKLRDIILRMGMAGRHSRQEERRKLQCPWCLFPIIYNFALAGAAFANIGSILVAINSHQQNSLSTLLGYQLTLHNIPLNLQLPAQKQILRLRLAGYHLPEVLVAHTQHHVRFFASWGFALRHCAGFLQVDVPCFFLPGAVLQLEGEDSGAFFDGVFAVGFVFFQGGVDGVEGGGGGEGVCEGLDAMGVGRKGRRTALERHDGGGG